MNDKNNTENAYFSKEVSDVLQIGDSTLRKWSLALENNGYTFVRGANNSRAFTDSDIILLRRLKSLIKDKRIAVDTAVGIVLSRVSEVERTAGVLEVNGVHNQNGSALDVINDLLERTERLEQINLELVRKLDEQFSNMNRMLEQWSKREEQLLLESKSQEDELRQVNEKLEKQEQFNQQLLEHLKEIKQNNGQTVEVLSNRDEKLMEALREIQEMKEMQKLIAASAEEKDEEKSKKGLFSWFKK